LNTNRRIISNYRGRTALEGYVQMFDDNGLEGLNLKKKLSRAWRKIKEKAWLRIPIMFGLSQLVFGTLGRAMGSRTHAHGLFPKIGRALEKSTRFYGPGGHITKLLNPKTRAFDPLRGYKAAQATATSAANVAAGVTGPTVSNPATLSTGAGGAGAIQPGVDAGYSVADMVKTDVALSDQATSSYIKGITGATQSAASYVADAEGVSRLASSITPMSDAFSGPTAGTTDATWNFSGANLTKDAAAVITEGESGGLLNKIFNFKANQDTVFGQLLGRVLNPGIATAGDTGISDDWMRQLQEAAAAAAGVTGGMGYDGGMPDPYGSDGPAELDPAAIQEEIADQVAASQAAQQQKIIAVVAVGVIAYLIYVKFYKKGRK